MNGSNMVRVRIGGATKADDLPRPRPAAEDEHLATCTRCGTTARRPGHLPRELTCDCGSLLAFNAGRSRFLTASEIGSDATFSPVEQPATPSTRRSLRWP